MLNGMEFQTVGTAYLKASFNSNAVSHVLPVLSSHR